MLALLISFVASFVVALLLIRSSKFHSHRSGDRDFSKPQKIHALVVPRIGGAAIVLGLFCSIFSIGAVLGRDAMIFGLTLMACAAPTFFAGFIQDFTEAITPRGRLVATALSAILAIAVMDAEITRTHIPGLDLIVSFAAGSLLLTIFAVTGIANAINIIDGLNGLASMCIMLMLMGLAYVSFQVGDPLIGSLALAGIGAVLGFFLWNFPAGLIFLGDGGAYFLGFFVSELMILLLVRHPDAISPLFPLLVCIYPVFETVFSIYRRRFLRALPPSMPDGIHLHSLMYRRVMRWAVGDRSAKALARRNSMTSPYLWLLCSLSIAPAILFFNNSAMLGGLIVAFGVGYVALYWRIVRFKSPRWMVIRPAVRHESNTADNADA